MKKVFSLILCLVMLLGLATTTMAASPTVYTSLKVHFTSSSEFVAGGTVKVDESKILNDGNITAEVHDAVMERRVTYTWMRNDSEYAKGNSLTLTNSDKGYRFYCQASVYEDANKTNLFGVFFSEDFYVSDTSSSATIPEITTKSIPDGKVGESYYCRLDCTDADVVFGLYQSSLPDGMYITQHGEIEGIPTKAGNYHINVIATPEAGEDYATMESYDFTIEEAGPSYTIEIMELPKKLTYTAGEKLDMTGLRVRIWTPDGYMDSKDGDKLTYSQKELVTLGEQKIALRYEDAFEIFYVTVVAAPEKPTEAPTEAPTETPTEVPTEAPTGDVEDPGAKPSEDVGVDAPLGPDGVTTVGPDSNLPGEGGNSSDNTWILWVVIIILAAVLIVAAVVIIILASMRKKG